jgi:hypothetical protein
MKKIKDTSEALSRFEDAAIKHADAIEQGNHKAANKNCDLIIKVANFLKSESKLDLLTEFLTHSSDGVKVWAATYLLSINAEMAINVLEQIAKETGSRAFAAKITLKEWREGNLKL